MLKPVIEKILNEQIEKEFYSSNLYLAMASWAEANGYKGVADWLFAQAEEEKLHTLKFLRYINERGGHGLIPSVEKPPVEFDSVANLFKEVLKHEELITEAINQIVGKTIQENDFTTHNWVQWFVNEQLEEESAVRTIIDKIKLLGKDNDNLYLFDKDILSLRPAPAGTTAPTA